MHQLNIPSFGGVAGRVASQAFSFQTWLTGFLIISITAVFGYMTRLMGMGEGAFLLAHCIVPLVACRYALNGYHGEWRGSVFSLTGGSWLDVGLIAFRYVALTAIWVIPLTLLGAKPSVLVPSGLTILYATAWLMSPPLFLIVAISAPHFAAIFYPQFWRDTFRNRGGDLLSLYLVYTGTATSISLLTLPLAIGLGAVHKAPGVATIAVAAPLTVGLMLNVLGRLCGFFPISDSRNTDKPLESINRAPTTDGARSRTLSGKPVLVGARQRIDGILSGLEANPESALQELEALHTQFDPNPLLMHALCILYQQTGREEASFSLAEEALPFLLQHGNLKLSSEIYLAHIQHSSEFELTADELMEIGNYLRSENNAGGAAHAFKAVLHLDPAHIKAIKTMMHVAEEMANKGSPDEAAGLYSYLLDACPDSPLAEYMWQGLNQVERKRA